MRVSGIRAFIYPFFILSIFSCYSYKTLPLEPVQTSRQKTASKKAFDAMVERVELEANKRSETWNDAAMYWRAGNIEQSAAEMKKYIELDPDSAEAHNIIGLDYFSRGLYDLAADEFNIAAKLRPDEERFSYNSALALVRLERYEEADQAFAKAAGMKEGEYLRQVYADLIPLNRARKLYNAGCDAMRESHPVRAIDLFNSALRIRPDMAEAHVNLGVIYRKRRDSKNEIKHFEEAAKIKPDGPDIHYNLGLAYFDAKTYSQARAEFIKAIELDPYHRNAHFKLGMTFYMIQDYANAATEFERCLEIFPHWFDAHTNLGTCYLKTANVEGAIEQFEEAIKLRPRSAEAHYNLGEAYMRAKEFDKTKELFQKALEIDPDHEQARTRLEELEKYQRGGTLIEIRRSD